MHSASFAGKRSHEANSFFFASFFSLRGKRFLSFFTSFGIFFFGGVAGLGDAAAASFGCSFSGLALSGSAFFRVAIATKHTTLPCHNFFSRAKFVVEDRG
jgi:hypothetical protein